MNNRQVVALVIGVVVAFGAVLALPRPAPGRVIPGPRVAGGQIYTVEERLPPVTSAVFLGVAALTAGVIYALRTRGVA